MKPEPGAVLQDRYRILRKIGEGGMGAVYEGEHLLIQRRVAIKILQPQLSDRSEVVERFHREARAATAIGHPNIIEVTDFGQLEDGSPFMVLELLEGRDWSGDLREQGAQSLGRVAHIMVQVCRALSAAHDKRIVHRDLKPENIFLLPRQGDPDFVKVLDFGISKFQDRPGETEVNEHRLTKTGAALGTPYYMSPEACQGRPDLDHRADIYSLGVILFQALTGQYPFDDATYPMLVLKICTQPPPEMAQWRPDLPLGVVALVRSMLEKRPDRRPQSCAEVEAALRPYLGDTSAVATVAGAPSTASIQAQGSAEDVLAPRTMPTVNLSPPAPPTPALPPTPMSRPSARSMVLGGLLLLLAATGGLVFGFTRPVEEVPATVVDRGPPPAPPVDEGSPPVDEGPPLVAAPPPPEPAGSADRPPSSVAVVDRVRVQIRATPRRAVLRLDGLEIPHPFDEELEASDTPHTLRVTARGYRPEERRVWVRRRADGGAPEPIEVHLERVRHQPPPIEDRPVIVSPPLQEPRGGRHDGPADESVFRLGQGRRSR